LDIGAIWELIILNPMINVLIVVSKFLFNNPGIAIIVFTIVIRLAMYPLTRKQLKSSKKMQEMQPKIQELQKKYAKDRQKLAKEQAALLKEAGVTNIGCVLPMLIQMPIWIALYQSIIRVLPAMPEELLNLSHHLYSSWGIVFPMVPLNSQFLWLNLGATDTLLILPITVGITMWLQQKMVTPTATDPQQKASSQMMMFMMPLMFAYFTMISPSGLGLYWLISNLFGIVQQYFFSGWGGLATLFGKKPAEVKPDTKSTSGTAKIQSTKNIDSVARKVSTSPQKIEKRKSRWKFWK
jgi:YidC/Oxa1 family membrane protein insertase